MRTVRTAALGATLLALLVGACSSGGGSTTVPSLVASAPPSAPSGEPSASAEGPGLSATLVLGGPPECPGRPFCLLGLQETYGLEFAEFKPLDAGGPLTVEALRSGEIDVGLLFTSDPAILANEFVLLEDDRGLQNADNIIPVVRQEVLDAAPGAADVLNAIMAKLTQEELIGLNTAATIELEPIPDVVSAWLERHGLAAGGAGLSGEASVGSANFPESEILGELFAQALERNGMSIERRFQISNRETYWAAVRSGEIDVMPEYAATLLEFVNEDAGEATDDAEETAAKLRQRLEPDGLTALDPAPATDQNGFVVTKETAARYGLSKLSDLARPAP